MKHKTKERQMEYLCERVGPGVLERNYALSESKGKWELVKALANREDYNTIERVMGIRCGVCTLAGACVMCPANGKCQSFSDALINKLDETPTSKSGVLSIIDAILEYIDELKRKV